MYKCITLELKMKFVHTFKHKLKKDFLLVHLAQTPHKINKRYINIISGVQYLYILYMNIEYNDKTTQYNVQIHVQIHGVQVAVHSICIHVHVHVLMASGSGTL